MRAVTIPLSYPLCRAEKSALRYLGHISAASILLLPRICKMRDARVMPM
jgi:hypothetical protein